MFALLSILIPQQTQAVIMPTNADKTVFQNQTDNKQTAVLQTGQDDKKAKSLRIAVRVLGLLFVAFLLLTLAVPFGTKGVVFLLALLCLLVALFLALAGVSNAKDKEAKKKARKSLWFLLGVFLGVIALGIIVLLNVRIA